MKAAAQSKSAKLRCPQNYEYGSQNLRLQLQNCKNIYIYIILIFNFWSILTVYLFFP